MINMTQNTKNMEKSFFKYVLPAIASTMLGGLYIVVDGFFVGNSMGDNGLTAINLVYPIGTLIAACAVMLGMGGSVIMSTYFGGGDSKGFNKAKSNTFITLILASVILTVILLLLKNKLIYLLGARDNVFKLADEYITVIILGGSFQIISYGIMPMIRNLGKTIHAMAFMVAGLITNIILDYLFLMVLRLGMFGAALATIIAEGIVALISLYYLFIRKKYRIKLSDFDLSMTKRAIQIGLSPFGLVMAPSLIVIFNNWQCIKYGGYTAASAYSVINYIYGSVIYLFEGIAEGCQPMISYFKGAKRNDLMKKVFKKGVLFALIIASIILSIILIFKNNFGILFGASIETNDIISKGLILISVSFILQPIVRLGTAYFYSSGESRYSALLTYIDPLFVSPLCILVLPLFFNLDGVWLALPFSQFILIVLFIFIFYNTNIKDKDFIKKTVY
ncbi:MATE family efflux transporter [Brachyspira murdochii]|uniref:Multi antimicrobial extrusion protein MatE n=1 Tax=Brachyspira murdochii (strain ATCC 51284 / DSM 12563 / 56-150) TaxID=526224 RepID=D5UB31_BRAM5|nr:MATE family efflux transporter [Brachyspira murdochii]ADG71904.1 multi antimicrobial extrusion protein MatE [Brachyspira murdochii DSM 12563]